MTKKRNKNKTTPKKGPVGVGTSRRAACSADFLASIFSEVFTPRQIETVKLHDKKDYGMDTEIFKLIQAYLSIPDFRVLIGNAQFQAPETSLTSTIMSKVERIRWEVQDVRASTRMKLDDHLEIMFDYIVTRAEEEHQWCEMVDYLDRANPLVPILQDMPKKDDVRPKLKKGEEKRLVVVHSTPWGAQSYAINITIYETYPEFKPFFCSSYGRGFVTEFNKFLRNHFPNMQSGMLDRVNSFAFNYFNWLRSLMDFHTDALLDGSWKYTPLTPPPIVLPPNDPLEQYESVVRVFRSPYATAGNEKFFFFLDDVRLILDKLRIQGCEFRRPMTQMDLRKNAPKPMYHRIAEVYKPEDVLTIMSIMCPETSMLCCTQTVQCYHWNELQFPIVSPYNTHCIPAHDAFKRLVEVLLLEAEIGRKVPITFGPLVGMIRKMENLFCKTANVYKLFVDRKPVHDLIQDATSLRTKFKGKMTASEADFGLLDEIAGLGYTELESIFLSSFKQFMKFAQRKNGIKGPAGNPLGAFMLEGEPKDEFIDMYLDGGFETIEEREAHWNRERRAADVIPEEDEEPRDEPEDVSDEQEEVSDEESDDVSDEESDDCSDEESHDNP